MPIEVLRTRVKRAADLGLDYRTYASVRAASGDDVVAFLFSSNPLQVAPLRLVMPVERSAKLAGVGADRIALVVGRAFDAPDVWAGFGAAGRVIRVALDRVPGDRVLLVGDTEFERDWCAAGRLAGYVTAARYFGAGA